MEYCGGGSVADLMNVTEEPLEEYQIAYICREALKVWLTLIDLNWRINEAKQFKLLCLQKTLLNFVEENSKVYLFAVVYISKCFLGFYVLCSQYFI